MRTTLEVRMDLRSRRKVRQETAALIVFLKPTFCLKKAKNSTRTWREHQLYQPCLRATSSAQTGQLASAVVEVMDRDMRSCPPLIPTSYHLSASLEAR
ncbi:hypothetical protein AVEN_166720-1 [Araneus ventricosus]|uniref:Uncharacterized protein n=1 Tax=Araneus ventricosus TaxID=182803 RepID=A0A4Y2G039_ARAVE|nr:hypothetical protein AVEN_166720-1 [Araneus ventricosus]